MSKIRIGWILLLLSLFWNVVLGYSNYMRRDEITKDQALLFALDRCQEKLARYAEVKAVADAYDKMLEEKAQ